MNHVQQIGPNTHLWESHGLYVKTCYSPGLGFSARIDTYATDYTLSVESHLVTNRFVDGDMHDHEAEALKAFTEPQKIWSAIVQHEDLKTLEKFFLEAPECTDLT